MLRRTFLAGALAATPAIGRAQSVTRYDASLPELDAFIRDHNFSGVVTLGRTGEIGFARAFGMADIEAQQPATTTTAYALGSTSKWLTTIGVLRLVDAGQIDLDQPVTRYLPGYRPDTGEHVALRHLLSNTSGIPDQLSPAAKADPALRSLVASATDVVSRYGEGDLIFEPGSRFDYSMMNWVIVRALLEEHSGEAFPALIDRLVFKPLGLQATGVAEQGFDSIPGLAIAYSSTEPPVRKIDPIPAFAAAAGTFYSNAPDILRTAHAVFDSDFLSASARTELTNVVTDEEGYALGGRVRVIEGRRWAWETGRIGGYRSHIAHALADERSIIVLCNNDAPQSDLEKFVEQVARS